MRAKTFLGNLTLANQLTFLQLVAVPFFILSIPKGRFTVAFALFIGAAIWICLALVPISARGHPADPPGKQP